MKKSLLFVLLLFTLRVFPQNYHPLLGDSTSWKIWECVTFMGQCFNNGYYTSTDTFISGHTYKQIVYTGSISLYTSYLREDTLNKKVYSLINGTDQLTYDFSLNLNDSVYLHWKDGSSGASNFNGFYQVDSVAINNTLAGPRKFMRLRGSYPNIQYWLEGVGALDNYLDYPQNYCDVIDCGSYQKTYCQTKGGIQTYERSPLYSCDSGQLYDCSVTNSYVRVDSDYVFFADINGVGPYTYQWFLYQTDTGWVAIDSSSYPSPHFVLAPNHYYSAYLHATDTAGCFVYGSSSFYDSVPTVAHYCDALFWIYPDTIDGNYIAEDLSSGSNLSYLWDFGDGSTSTMQYPSHQYSSPNHYTVCLTVNNGNGCNSTYCNSAFYNYKAGGGPMSVLNIKGALTAISPIRNSNSAIRISPNPFSSSFSVSLQKENLQQANLTVTDVAGRVVSQFQISNFKFQINTNNWSAGVYFLQVIADGERSVRQLIKQ